jgi:hypothetical protein
MAGIGQTVSGFPPQSLLLLAEPFRRQMLPWGFPLGHQRGRLMTDVKVPAGQQEQQRSKRGQKFHSLMVNNGKLAIPAGSLGGRVLFGWKRNRAGNNPRIPEIQ